MSRLKILMLTGKHSHDWEKSSNFCKEKLERTGRFEVTVTTDPSKTLENKSELNQYVAFFVDYFGPNWSEEAQLNFAERIYEGIGLIVLHGSGVGFEGWTEFEKMAGLLWREGTNHGNFYEFEVTILDKEHPITKGIKNFRHWDELYYNMVNPWEQPFHVLASAYSDPEIKRWDGEGGTGKFEPVMLTNQYGKGRIFYQILGHVWPIDYGNGFKGNTLIALEDENFIKTLVRGSEWVATGEVTID